MSMRKLYLLIVVLSIGSVLQAQNDSLVSYSSMVTLPGVNKQSLFIRARQWVTESFPDSEYNFRVADSTTGELTVKTDYWIAFSHRLLGDRQYFTRANMTVNIWDFRAGSDAVARKLMATLQSKMENPDSTVF